MTLPCVKNNQINKAAFIGLLMILLMPWHSAGAALKIDITQGNVEPLPIAILDFVSEDGVGGDWRKW